jgi:glyoxylase-like metal-dependent hydrolase (beta-lactamase superfamily II)
VNAYLFVAPEIVLVDTGISSPESWAALQTGLAAFNLTVADLQRVIITHAHVDHFGQSADILAHSTARVEVADIGAPWLLQPKLMWQRRLDYYAQRFLPCAGLARPQIEQVLAFMGQSRDSSHAIAVERMEQFHIGEKLEMGGRPWQVLHMPGHASHQTSFWQQETGHFLSGDMLLHKTPTPVVEAPVGGEERIPALPQFLSSLDRCADLPIETVFPGHGAPFGDHRALIASQRARIYQRRDELLEMIREGNHALPVLLQGMYGGRSVTAQFAGLWMLIGYLDLLLGDGRLVQKEIGGIWHYFLRE